MNSNNITSYEVINSSEEMTSIHTSRGIQIGLTLVLLSWFYNLMSISAKLNNRPSCETRQGGEEEESASSCETNDLRELIQDDSTHSSSSNISIWKEDEEETVQRISTTSTSTSGNVEDYGFFFIMDEEIETKPRKAPHDNEIILR